MDRKELAALLNGRQYMNEVTEAEARQAREDGLVIVYGYSDDNMEFDGAIRDEVGCYNGGTAYLGEKGLLYNDCDNDDCPHFAKLQAKAPSITAKFDVDGYTWVYETAIPHDTFDIWEGEETYCRGIVFSLSDARQPSINEETNE